MALHEPRARADVLILGRVDEARTLYLQYRGAKDVGTESPETGVLEDFAELHEAGLTHPLMDEIEKWFAAEG